MAVAITQPVPSYALPFLGNKEELDRIGLKFNPQWLKWFLDMIDTLAVGGGVDHGLLAGLQGGAAGEFYHLTTAQHTTLTAAKAANLVYAGPAAGAAAIPAFRALVTADLPAGTGTVTSVGQTFTGGLISVAGSPVTAAGTLALTVAGTSGGIPYFSGATTWASSAALGSNQLVRGGGAGVAPSTDANLVFDPVNIRLGIGVSPTYHIDLVAPAIVGAESMFRMAVSDAANDFFAISNTTAIANRFIPFFRGHVESNNAGSLVFAAEALTTQDSGTSPVTWFISRLQAAGLGAVSNVAVRPTFEWFNNATSQLRIEATSKAIFAAGIDTGGTIRAMGAITPAAGAGVEIIYSASVGQIYAYDRTGVAEKDLSLGLGSIYLKADGNNGFGGNTSPTAKMHPAAGTSAANTAPKQFTTGARETTARTGVREYDSNHYGTNWKLIRFPLGGPIFDHFADVSVGGAETDIYTNTLLANIFAINGDKVIASYGGNFVTLGTELTQLKAYFAGTAIWDSTAIALAAGTNSWQVCVDLIRVSATVVRYAVYLSTTGASGFVYCTVGELTGLTLTGTNILKLTGTSSGVGSGAGDIVGKQAYVEYKPAVN